MIKNTEAFYAKAKQYQDKRTKMVADYERTLAGLEKYRGSKGFEKDLEKIKKEHNEALSALQDEYGQSLRTILKGMEDALDRRNVNPPTNEQLNLIHLLKMRDKVTEEELDRASENLKNNGIAMGLIQEIAVKNGIGKNYERLCKEMSTNYAHKVLKEIDFALDDWIMHDTKLSGRKARQFHDERYGASQIETALPKRPLFEDMDGCFADLAGLSHDGLMLFSKAVDIE